MGDGRGGGFQQLISWFCGKRKKKKEKKEGCVAIRTGSVIGIMGKKKKKRKLSNEEGEGAFADFQRTRPIAVAN